jgi:hypothetical protein
LSLVARYTSKRERERAVIFSFSIFTCYQFAGKGSVRRCEANAAKRRERQQTPSRDPCHHQIGWWSVSELMSSRDKIRSRVQREKEEEEEED